VDHTWAELALVAAVGLVAGFVNVAAGGGSLLAIPALIFIGLPATVANGTIRIAVIVQTGTAVFRYARARRLELRTVKKTVFPALIGAGIGAWAATWISDGGFKHVLVGVILVATGALVIQPLLPASWRLKEVTKRPDWLVALLMIGVGLYGGFIQAGVGFLLIAVLVMGAGLPLVEANIVKVAVVLAYTPIALGLFIANDKVDLQAGASLAAGQAVGAWVSAGLTLNKGARFIRIVLAVMLVAATVKLLLG